MDESPSAPQPPPLHSQHLHRLTPLLRTHTILHTLALTLILLRRLHTLTLALTAPVLLITLSELLLSITFLLSQPLRWSLRYRTPHPSHLPDDDHLLPSIDVFICTADPKKEPTVDVMSTVVSAMGLEYPARKLRVFVGDDGGAEVTLVGLRAARSFARKWWLPFCRRRGVKCRSPKAFFQDEVVEVSACGGV